jgi:hypothetical protein
MQRAEFSGGSSRLNQETFSYLQPIDSYDYFYSSNTIPAAIVPREEKDLSMTIWLAYSLSTLVTFHPSRQYIIDLSMNFRETVYKI